MFLFFFRCQPRVEGAGNPSQQIEVTYSELNQTTNYNSIHFAARALNISHSIIVGGGANAEHCFNSRNQPTG